MTNQISDNPLIFFTSVCWFFFKEFAVLGVFNWKFLNYFVFKIIISVEIYCLLNNGKMP